MRVRVLYFAHLAEAANRREDSIDLPQGATVERALEEVGRRNGSVRFAQSIASAAVAVNERYARRSDILRDGDTMAIIPPVSGG